MRATTLAKPSLMFAMAGLAMPAHATVLAVDYSPTIAGTPITLGGAASPQFTFINDGGNPGAKNYIEANGTASIMAPGGLPTTKVQTSLFFFGNPVNFTDGFYDIGFGVGANYYYGTIVVDGDGNHISYITDNVPSPAVPELGTWAMMLLGLGTVGASMRAGRQDADLAAIA